MLYVPVNNFSVMSGWVFLGPTSTKQRISLCVWGGGGGRHLFLAHLSQKVKVNYCD